MRLGSAPELELEELLSLEHEGRSFEVKGPGAPGDLRDRAYVAKIAKAVMAMGNLRDGGMVCLGISDKAMTAMLPGLTPKQSEAWTNFDEVHTALARFADPPVAFETRRLRLSSGAEVVVLEVDEFDSVPHVCRKDYPGELNAGELYVRPLGMPRSARVPDAREMREVLDNATDKGVREFLRRTRAAGVSLVSQPSPVELDRVAFDAERTEAWSAASPLLDQLAAIGHTDVAIRPGPYDAERIGPAALEMVLQEQTVRMRGWPLPYIDSKAVIERHGSFIGQDVEPAVVPHLEAWRLFTSGQFLHRRALATDMRDSPMLKPTDDGATGAVALWDIVLYMVEVSELAARFAQVLRCKEVSFAVGLAGVAGRQLIAGDHRESIRPGLIVHRGILTTERQISTETLLANVRGTGISLAQGLLTQFGLDLPDTALNDLQQRVFGV